jgi:DNA-binding MarR family transcriptional regulator
MKTTVSRSMNHFNHLTSEINAVYHMASWKLGLSDSVSQILYTLCELDGSCLLTDIRHLTGLSKQTVNSAIRSLERDGMIRLEPVDAKSKKVVLTKQGVRFAGQTVGKLIEAENEIFDSWSDAEIRQYLTLTERYLKALTEKTEAL